VRRRADEGDSLGGICGVVSRAGHEPHEDVLEAMVGAAPHRATGAVGRHVSQGGAIAMLTRDGAGGPLRPHVDPQLDVVATAHARIDNVAELRHLLADDAPQPTARDLALIVALYRRWGDAGLARLIGDFACVLWDRRRQRLVLARDPMAMRPLYYRVEPDRVLFASEVAQLLAVPGVPVEPDERMLAAYLSGSFGDPSWSYYAGIAQVPPSHVVAVDGGSVQVRRVWDVDPHHTIEYDTEEEYAEHLRGLFLEAVRARLVGGRPAGVLLSGGIDSGAVASAAGWLREREHAIDGLHSYSWDFGDLTECDERHISRHVVERYGLTATDVPVQDAGPFAGYPAHAPHLDDPFHGHFQTMLDRGFASAAADGVGPLFTGMRGDLAIGPVDVDYATLLARGRVGDVGRELRTHHRATGEGPADLVSTHVGPAALAAARGSTAAAWLRWALGRRPDRPRSSSPNLDDRVPPWVEPRFARRVGLSDLLDTYAESPSPRLDGPLRRRRYEWLFMPMHLRWAVSHERRVAGFGMDAVDPWSDRRIAEFCVAIPQQVIQPPGVIDKRLARSALAGIAPPAFLAQAGKTVPRPLYLRTLRTTAVPTVRELLSSSRAAEAGWLDPEPLREDYERFVAGGSIDGRIWWALSLEWWLRSLE
jgi:asparagine synthase (glutamine-hydrolysing)